jgi:hypothetical protein
MILPPHLPYPVEGTYKFDLSADSSAVRMNSVPYKEIIHHFIIWHYVT